MKQRTLTFFNRLLLLAIVALGVCSCKTKRIAKDSNKDIEIESTKTMRLMYGAPPVNFRDSVTTDTTTTPNKTARDTINQRKLNPGMIHVLYGVRPREFQQPNETKSTQK
ncbi:MAG: hypothetical protein Q4D14_00415 [Bacteroidales bacterium]|nr:hypothetical protein [Bacteroidales bacterium]